MEKNIFTLLFQAALSERENRLMFQQNANPEAPKTQKVEVAADADTSNPFLTAEERLAEVAQKLADTEKQKAAQQQVEEARGVTVNRNGEQLSVYSQNPDSEVFIEENGVEKTVTTGSDGFVSVDVPKDAVVDVKNNVVTINYMTPEQKKWVEDSVASVGDFIKDPKAVNDLLASAGSALDAYGDKFKDMLAKISKQPAQTPVSVERTTVPNKKLFEHLRALGDELKGMVPDQAKRDAMVEDVSAKVKDFFKPARKTEKADADKKVFEGDKLSKEAQKALENADSDKDARKALDIVNKEIKEKGLNAEKIAKEFNDITPIGEGRYEVKKGQVVFVKESTEDKELNKFQQMLDMLLKFFEKMMQMENKNAINRGNVPAIRAALKELDIKEGVLKKDTTKSEEEKNAEQKLIDADRLELQTRLDDAQKLDKALDKANKEFAAALNEKAEQSGASFHAEAPKPGVSGIVVVPNPDAPKAQARREIKEFTREVTNRNPKVKIDQTAGRDAISVYIGDNATITMNNSITAKNGSTVIADQSNGIPNFRRGTATETAVDDEVVIEDTAPKPSQSGSANG